jgi:hypothetical protein
MSQLALGEAAAEAQDADAAEADATEAADADETDATEAADADDTEYTEAIEAAVDTTEVAPAHSAFVLTT